MGSILTNWTIYLSLMCYAVAVVCTLNRRLRGLYRGAWSAACLLLWGHAASAFHFYFAWSHAAAVAETARQTQEVLGWSFGAGIWFSYALMALWLIDVVRLWSTSSGAKCNRLATVVHLYAFFILFNGTVIFERGPIRWFGMIVTAGLIGSIFARYRRRSTPSPASPYIRP